MHVGVYKNLFSVEKVGAILEFEKMVWKLIIINKDKMSNKIIIEEKFALH